MHTLLAAMIRRSFAALALLLAACGGAHRNEEKPAPQENTAPAKVNLEEIFPPGPGRDLVLSNCTTCHTFVPIVVLQMSRQAWERNGRDHRERVKALSDADFKTLYQYLTENFNPDRPVPKLPNALMETWTAY